MIEIILAALALFSLAIIVEIILLIFEELIAWFDSQYENKNLDTDDIAFTVTKSIENGEATFVRGVLNKKKNKVAVAEEVHAESLDEQTEDILRRKKVAIYT